MPPSGTSSTAEPRRSPDKIPDMMIMLTLLLMLTPQLVVPQSTGVPTRLYKIPPSYRAHLDAFSTSSVPPDVSDTTETATASIDTATTTVTDEPLRRRHIQVLPSDEDRFAKNCVGSKECARDDHPASKLLLDKFLKDYQSMNGGDLPNTPDKGTALAFLNKQLKENDELEPNLSNRLANLYVGNDYNSTDEKDTRSKGSHWDVYPQPYDDDRDGWVTLEAVPWSQSKITKWYTSNKPHWSNNVHPSRPPHDWGSVERPPSWGERPSDWAFEKPSRPEHWHPPSEDPWPSPSRPQHKPSFQYHTSSHHHDIITDDSPHHWAPHGGVPGEYKPWPTSGGSHSFNTHRPTSPSYNYDHHSPFHHDRHPPGHPDNSDGEWVLVSNTKGYSTPHRYKNYKRALTFNAKPMTSTRSVRLTVLPDGNTTTSHGGLLEVQESFDTVDEDREQMERRKQLQLRPQNDPLPTTNNRYPNRAPARRPTVPARRPFMVGRRPAAQQARRPVIAVLAPGARTQAVTTPAPAYRNRAAMLAAVTAGVVPATMAVVVPAMMMGRRRRRRRSAGTPVNWRLVVRQTGKKGKGTRKVVRRKKQQLDKVKGHRLILPPPHIRSAFNSFTH